MLQLGSLSLGPKYQGGRVGDLCRCREALGRLFRKVGVMYPELTRHSFLVRRSGEVVLRNSQEAFDTRDEEVLRQRLEELEGVLNGPSVMDEY
jgi:hypothetical protein